MSSNEAQFNDPLTPREEQVMACIVSGRLNREIGIDLGISERTVEVHRIRIRTKLGARNSADIVRIALARPSND